MTKNSIKLNVIQWLIEESKNEKKLEEIVNDFEGKENLWRCEIGLKKLSNRPFQFVDQNNKKEKHRFKKLVEVHSHTQFNVQWC